jgi:LEA14-like dessication related protein
MAVTNVEMTIKNIKHWILSIIILFAVVSCKKLEAPVFESIENVEIKDRTTTQVILAAEVNFYNPNNYKITLKHANIDVLLNDKIITNYTRDYNIKIEKNEHFSVPVEFSISLSDINSNVITSAINALLGKKQKLSYKGHIKIKAFGFRIKVPVDGNTDFDLNDF